MSEKRKYVHSSYGKRDAITFFEFLIYTQVTFEDLVEKIAATFNPLARI